MTKQEFATLVVAMQTMYGEDFIGTEQELDVWYTNNRGRKKCDFIRWSFLNYFKIKYLK